MARFTSYPNKSKPADSDTLLINDASASANKQILLSGLFAWLKDKFTNTPISGLETTNQTIVGAINELHDAVEEGGSASEIEQIRSDVDDLKADLEDLDERVEALEGGAGGGLTADIKSALLALFQHVAYADYDGQDYYDALYDALYPPADLVSISAVYTQSGTIYETNELDDLKDDLIVTALMSDQTTQTVTNYTLSGTLTEGTSTITVTYGGKTTSFNVTVTVLPDERVLLYNWDFTQSLEDSVSGATVTLGYKSGTTALERTSSGISFTTADQRIAFPTSIAMDMSGKTIEIDVEEFDFQGSSSAHVRFLLLNDNVNASNNGWGPIIYRANTGWSAYGTSNSSTSYASWTSTWGNIGINAFDGKTVKVVFDSDGHTMSLYLDNVLVGTLTSLYFDNEKHRRLLIGGTNTASGENNGNQCYDMTITGVRIYENAAEGDSEET